MTEVWLRVSAAAVRVEHSDYPTWPVAAPLLLSGRGEQGHLSLWATPTAVGILTLAGLEGSVGRLAGALSQESSVAGHPAQGPCCQARCPWDLGLS